MRRLYIIVILTMICFNSFSQRSADLKFGLGLPVFTDNTKGIDEHYIKSIPTLSVEKPFAIKSGRDEKFSINPGASFFYFRENELEGNELTGRSIELNHMSLNGYVKFLYQQKIKKRSEAFVYFGGITGVHIYSHTWGKKVFHSQNPETPFYEENVSQSGKDFFNTIYYGALAGFQPNVKITNRLIPSFEVSYLPGFVSKNDNKTDAFQLSVLIGLNN